MDFKYLGDIKSLHEKTLNAALAEKAATFYLLECLHKVDKTRAFLELGYSSLFVYVHKALGYSEAQSFERIEAMRLAFRVEAVGASLRAGELTMTAVAKLATHAKRERLETPAVAELSRELLRKPVREIERVLAAKASATAGSGYAVARERMAPVAQGQSRLEVTIDEECRALLTEARELDANPGVPMAEILKRALRLYIDEKRRKKYGEHRTEAVVPAPAKSASGERSKDNHGAAVTGAHGVSGDRSNNGHGATRPQGGSNDRSAVAASSRYVSQPLRGALFSRAEDQCEFRSLITGQRCQEKAALQIDHRQPWALAGPTRLKNLQILCAAHNRAKGMRV